MTRKVMINVCINMCLVYHQFEGSRVVGADVGGCEIVPPYRCQSDFHQGAGKEAEDE